MPNTTTEIRAGFFDSIDGDRKYYASDMVMPYSRLVSEGIYGRDNSDEKGSDFNPTVNTNTEVIITAGQGILNGRWFQLETDLPVTIDTNGTLSNRVDCIAICSDNTSGVRAVSIQYLLGTGSTAPTLTDTEDIKYLRICNITVAPSSSGGSLSIEDCRGTSECPIIVGLIKEISADDFLTQFRNSYNTWFEGVQNQWDSYYSQTGTEWDTYFEGVKSQWDAQLLEIQNQWNTYYSSVENQWQSKLEEVQAEWEEWMETVRSGAVFNMIQQSVEYDGSTAPTIENYNALTDQIILSINGLIARPTVEYSISSTGVVTFVNTINSGAIIDIIIFRTTSA